MNTNNFPNFNMNVNFPTNLNFPINNNPTNIFNPNNNFNVNTNFNLNNNMNMNNNVNMNMVTQNAFYFPQMIPYNPLYYAYINRNPININDFEKINILGAGKHGSVGKYRNRYNNQIYAIKIMDQKLFRDPKEGITSETDYIREILVLSDLNLKNHFGIIKLYAFFQDNNNRYLVIEFVEGKNLKSLREEQSNKNMYITQTKIVSILQQLLNILYFLHSNYIIHRDIKPENIIMDFNNNIKLLDFGLAVYLENPNNILVSRKSFKGSRVYVPPEILYSSKEGRFYDYKADIFCLGFTMYNLMNPKDLNGKPNLPKITDENNQRTDNQNNNKFYDDWLMDFIETFYSNDQTLRPTAEFALKYIIQNGNKRIKKNPNIAIPNNDNINIRRNLSTGINFNRDNFNINTNLNFNNINRQFTNVGDFEPDEFLQHNQGQENKITTSMKCLIHLLSSIFDMAYINAQFQSVFNIEENRSKNLFIKTYHNIFQNFNLMKKNLLQKENYNKKINEIISEVIQKNVSPTSGPRPIILYFMMSSIINKEFSELCPNYKNQLLDEILVMNSYLFNNILPYNLYKNLSDSIINQINNFKSKKKNPFVDYFCFLNLKIRKCQYCNNILDTEVYQCQLLQLNIKKGENIIDDLIFDHFREKFPKNNLICNQCKNNAQQIYDKLYCLNAPEYLILELEDRSKVYFKDEILLPLYDGTNINYKFIGAIYKRKIDNYSEYYSVCKEENNVILYDNDIFQKGNSDLINSDNPSMAIYQKNAKK